MSSSRALCLTSVLKQKHNFLFRSMYNKAISRLGFCDIQNKEGLSKRFSASASAGNSCLDLDYSGYHKKPHPVIVHCVHKKKCATV